jgi:arylsulfatase A-like enzyme
MHIHHKLSHLDLVPTLVALAGGTLPTDRAYDGMNLIPLFNNEANTSYINQLNTRVLLHPGDHNQEIYAVRLGVNTKVFVLSSSAAVCGEAYYTDGNKANTTLIFNLTEDPAEAFPQFRNSSKEALAFSLAAYDAIVKFNISLVPGLQV